jgi:hypothetical protein
VRARPERVLQCGSGTDFATWITQSGLRKVGYTNRIMQIAPIAPA